MKSRFEGKEKHVEKARKRGKMLARERIELVVDKTLCGTSTTSWHGKRGFWHGGTNILVSD